MEPSRMGMSSFAGYALGCAIPNVGALPVRRGRGMAVKPTSKRRRDRARHPVPPAVGTAAPRVPNAEASVAC